MVIEKIVENWYLILAVVCCGGALGCALYRFCFEPRFDQIETVKEWLKIAVARAEKELGSGTGALKLAYCYDLFVMRFPSVARWITCKQFEEYVKEALVWFNRQLESNKSVKEYVSNENN